MTRHAKFRHGEGSFTPPPGLDRMRPRDVRITAAGWSLLALSAALVVGGVAGGIALQLKALRDADASRTFREHAVEATGVVTRKWRASGDDHPRWLAYEFTANGRVFRAETRASRALWDRTDLGAPVPVRFEPDRPERSFAWGRSPDALPRAVPFLAGAAAVVAGALLTIPVVRQRRLLAEGRAALATVTKQTKGQHGTMVHYAFQVLSGGSATGRTGATSKPPAVGSTMWVVYAPEDPRWNTPYPVSFVRLAHEEPLTPVRHRHETGRDGRLSSSSARARESP